MNLLLLNTPATGGKLEQALEKLIDFGMDAGKDILIAILIYVIGRFIIRQISALVARILEKRKIETSVQTFLKSLIKILLNMILAFAIIGKLGVETTSFAALLASAGVAVGMALSGNLSNFAGGLIILIFKPFKVGDYIDGPGISGTIKEIHLTLSLKSSACSGWRANSESLRKASSNPSSASNKENIFESSAPLLSASLSDKKAIA